VDGNNYGDVALNLKPEWSRKRETNKQYALRIVGHENGVADAYREKEPAARHQFAWVDPRYVDDISINRSKGYDFVTKTDWVKNERLWYWDAEGYCVNDGQRLMARPAHMYFEELEERERARSRRKDKAADEALAIAERAGIEIEDESGKRLTRKQRVQVAVPR
jgi:hypothetical protein